MKPCNACNGTGEILQDDGSDSTGTWIPCEVCNGTGENNDSHALLTKGDA